MIIILLIWYVNTDRVSFVLKNKNDGLWVQEAFGFEGFGILW